ncbi:Protein VAC14-like protein [Dichanthelium oligosanthes]|uniref:Protein VAC14-like protein n=1 Tax=Dichanthelium oligosanthes TaxID=888268 RepID=A0A1E5VXU9_9POAL|nr:Protein VAC14-like protein [Dichanthelium oligosanthes]
MAIIPAAVLRNLSDKLYEKRKNAAIQIEGIVKQLATSGERDKISAVISQITNDFIHAPQANHRKQTMPVVLNSFLDKDSRVRYYACEALYNIAKVVRGDLIIYFNKIFVLDSVPDIDMLGFLPDFLDGLFNMLSDSSHEIRQQADAALSEFLQEIMNSPHVDYGRMTEILVRRAGSTDEFTRLTSITWINEFVELGGEQLVPYYADILGAILPCISDQDKKILVVARETNEELRAIKADPTEGFDIGAILSIAKRELSSEHEATRIEALHWFSTLLARYRVEFLAYLNDIFHPLLNALSDPSDVVVVLVLEVHACIAEESHHFHHLVSYLIRTFHNNHVLLEKRGALIVRRLCVLLGAEKVYREFSTIIESEIDLDFASVMVQAWNLILLTSTELAEVRSLLKKSLVDSCGKDLFQSLYTSWCHSPMAMVSLCLLAQAYSHASCVIQSLGEEDINVNFLVQLDKLIRLLETPVFAYLRLQQSTAFKILRSRLKNVPFVENLKRTSSANPYSQILQVTEDGNRNQDTQNYSAINFPSLLQQFENMQQQHRNHFKCQLQSGKSASAATLSQVESFSTSYNDVMAWVAMGKQQQKGLNHTCMQQVGHNLLGRDDIRQNIMKKILLDRNGGSNCTVIFINGESGLGKTSLLRVLYNDQEIKDAFEKRIWIQISDKFDILMLFRKIIEFSMNGHCSITNINVLRELVSEEITNKKFLLFLDDANIEDQQSNHYLVMVAKRLISRFGSNPLNVKAIGGRLCHADTISLENDRFEGSVTELVLHCGHQLPEIPELVPLVSLKIEGFHGVKSFSLPAAAALPILKNLEISSCKELSSVDGLSALTTVRRLNTAGCPKLVPRTDNTST